VLIIAAVGLVATDARAIPAFARKYGTSCATCHTVYPKLNGFGETFRRNGFRFPGVDSDAAKTETIALGQERDAAAFPNAIWPGTLAAALPLALSVNGQALAHPAPHSSGALADHGTAFSLRDLVAEAHLWGGGSFDDRLTWFAQVTVTTQPSIELENAELHFNDLLGPPQALNLVVGRGSATLSTFGAHSSYLSDTALPSLAVAGLYGATSPSFALTAHTTGLELNGLALGLLTWSAGLTAGTNLDLRPTENVYAHLGLTVGGRSLLEGSPALADTSLTVDLFGYRANTRFTAASGEARQDVALVAGAAVRATWNTVEFDSGLSVEQHDHAQALADPTSDGVLALVHHDELSWVAWRWLVPALRVEYFRAMPQAAPITWDLRVMPGVAVLIRQNLKAVLLASFETAHGAPPAGWSAAGSVATPTATTPVVRFENESITLRLDAAF
jgi:hypothetical protein